MSRESEAGEIVSCELLVSGCDVSPILHAPKSTLLACERSQTIDYALIRRS